MNGLILPARLLLQQKLEALFRKRNKVATRNFVRALVELAQADGYSVDKGDRIFIHPNDIPKTVELGPEDPVVSSTAPAIFEGRLLFVRSQDLPGALMVPPVLYVKKDSEGTH